MAPREPHGFQELRHQLFKVNVELEWFEQWITKRPYIWEQAPEEKKPESSRDKETPTAAGGARARARPLTLPLPASGARVFRSLPRPAERGEGWGEG